MSGIVGAFERLRAAGQPGLVTYVTAGDPDLERTASILRTLDRAGADIIEVGVPFSDPIADGSAIQRACERALASGTTLPAVLGLLRRLRADVAAPLVLFSYLNPVLRMDPGRFADAAAAAGVDGVLLLDAPPEECHELRALLRARAIDPIFLVSPSTSAARLRAIAAEASGFIYAVSRLGVTGTRTHVDPAARALVERIRSASDLPVALGFGISTPEQVREVSGWAEAAVVGSALVERIAVGGPGIEPELDAFVRSLKARPTVLA